jgi:hypothetical protein
MEDQEAPEQSAPWSPPSQPDNQKLCRYCRQSIHRDAKVCHLCRYHQKRYVQYFSYIQSIGLVLTIIALVLSSLQLREARQQRISASEAMRNAGIASERASESVTKVEALVTQVQAAETKIEALVTQARTIEQHILEIEERQILRTWINILPNGDELLNPISGGKREDGGIRRTVGPQWSEGAPFKSVKGPKWEWECDGKTILQLSALIQELPYVPYAYVARADCFKKLGASFWRSDAERAKKLLEKMVTIQPHPREIEDFYKLCLSLFNS